MAASDEQCRELDRMREMDGGSVRENIALKGIEGGSYFWKEFLRDLDQSRIPEWNRLGKWMKELFFDLIG